MEDSSNVDTTNSSNISNNDLFLEDSVEVRASKVLAYSLIILMSLVGNGLVVCVIYREKRLKTNTNRFIVNMCTSDILTTASVLPQQITAILSNNKWLITGDFGNILCKTVPLIQDLSAGVSILSMAVIAFDRFFAVVLPFKAHIITTSRCYIMIAFTWIIAFVLHIPYICFFKLYQFEDNHYECRQLWPPVLTDNNVHKIYFVLMFSLLFALPLMSIAFFYTAVILELNRKEKTENQNIIQQRTRRRENREVSFMLVTVVVLFAVSYAPLNVLAFLFFFKWDVESQTPNYSRTLTFIANFMIHSNAAQNAIIYFTFNSRFKEGLKRLFVSGYRSQMNGLDYSNASTSNVKRFNVNGKRKSEITKEEKLELTTGLNGCGVQWKRTSSRRKQMERQRETKITLS